MMISVFLQITLFISQQAVSCPLYSPWQETSNSTFQYYQHRDELNLFMYALHVCEYNLILVVHLCYSSVHEPTWTTDTGPSLAIML